MAQKLITELSLRDDVDDNVNVPVDDTTQSYRTTAPQWFDYILAGLRAMYQTISSTGTALTNDDYIVLLDPTSASFTQNLPAVADVTTGLILVLKNIATNGNTVTIDGSGTELIDNAQTFLLESVNSMEGVTLFNNGSKWLIL